MDKNKSYENLYEIMEFPKGGIFSKVLLKSNNYSHTLMCLAKGANIDTHTSTKQGTVLVLKGKGIFILNDKKIKMKQGVFIFMLANVPHSLDAEEDLAILLGLIE